MRRLLGAGLAVCMLVFTAACDDSPTEPSERITFSATLLPANEVPPVTGAEASGTGTATINLNVNRDSGGAITSATADFQVNMSGFPAGTALTMAHIHRGAVGVNGDIVVNTGLTAGEVTLTTGTGTFTKTGQTVASGALAAEIIGNPAGFYFNVHSALNGGGVARGQLVRQ